MLFVSYNELSGAESAMLGSLTASVSILLALANSRVRCRRVRDESGDVVCLSACSGHGLGDSEELHVEQHVIGDKQVLLLNSRE